MSAASPSDATTPILIGCGQITQREPDPAAAMSPIDLTAAAARKALDDAEAGTALAEALDTIVMLRAFSDTSWRFACPFGKYTNPPKSLAARIGANQTKRLIYTHPGGNMPQWSVNRLFEQITRGEVGAALIAGGETLATQKAAQRAGLELNWSEDPGGEPEMWGVAAGALSSTASRPPVAGAPPVARAWPTPCPLAKRPGRAAPPLPSGGPPATHRDPATAAAVVQKPAQPVR